MSRFEPLSRHLVDSRRRMWREDAFIVSDLESAGWCEDFSRTAPGLAPAGHVLVQAQLPIRPGESRDAAHARLTALINVAVRMLRHGRCGGGRAHFSLLAGDWVEGRNHRLVMVPADLARAAVLAVIPAAWLLGWLSIPLLVAVAVRGWNGRSVRVRAEAGRRRRAHACEPRGARSSTTAQVAGPGVAGLLVQAIGPPLAIVVDAVSYLASALGIIAGRSRTSAPVAETPEVA